MSAVTPKAPGSDPSWPIALALFPCVLMGLWRVGADLAPVIEPGPALGAADSAGGINAALLRGALSFVPVLALSFALAWTWQRIFERGRERPPIAATFVTALLFALCLPPGLPWSAIALGMTFGVVVGRELFGGRGFVSPAVLGAVFVDLSHPGLVSSGWHPAVLGEDFAHFESSWLDLSLRGGGGSTFAEGSAVACMIGGVYLIVRGLISWRIVLGVLLGALLGALLAGDQAGPMPWAWAWHPMSGGLMFGAVFLATDPSVLAATSAGRLVQGLLTGGLIVLLRVAHERHPEGTISALLLVAVFSPLIDQIVRVTAGACRRRSHA